MKQIGVVIGLVVGLMMTVQALAQLQNQTPEFQALLRAARSLKFSVPENRAYILEKQEPVTEVALIFGYADNRSACQSIAEILIASRREGTFKCHPVY